MKRGVSRRSRAAGAFTDCCACVERVGPRRPLGDQPPVLHDVPGPVETERADEPVVAAEQRDELPVVERAVRDVHVRVAGDHADRLDLAVVLVRPDERHRRERAPSLTGEQALRGVDALLGRVRPVLEPHHLPVEQLVRPARDVAGGDDAGRREHRRVAHDAVVEREPAAFEPARLGHDADADDHEIGVDVEPSPSRTRSTRPSAFDACRRARRCGGRRRGRGAPPR